MAELYDNLKRLFSTDAVIRKVGGKKFKVIDTSGNQAFASRLMIDRFSRIHSSGNGYGTSPFGLSGRPELGPAYQTARLELFRDYDFMDNEPIIASALDIYADEATTHNEFGQILTVHSDNHEIKKILHNLFYEILNIEFNLWPWVRNMVKYGDFFLYLEIQPSHGIVNVVPLSVYDTTREEGKHKSNPFFVQFKSLNPLLSRKEFDNYEVCHFRLMSDSNFLPYGKSMVEAARRTWKQLQLMEDAMLIHRIMRSPEKRVFTVDIGNIPPNEVDNFMKKLKNEMQRVPLIDPRTGDYNLRHNVQNITEDFVLPVRGKESGTKIDTLKGLDWSGIEDVEYLRNKMMAALKVPKAFLGYEEQVNGKATLSAEDVRFAKTIERIQRMLVSELTKMAVIHLYSNGYTDSELVNFTLSLTNPSTIAEQEKISLWKEKVMLADEAMRIHLLGTDWIYKKVFNMSEEDIDEQRKYLSADAKRTFRFQSLEQGQPDPATRAGQMQLQQMQQGQMGAPGGAPQPGDLGGIPQDVGRPDEGLKMGTDDHPLGRDPLGNKENKAVTEDLQNFISYLSSRKPQLLDEIVENNVEIIDEQQQTYMDEDYTIVKSGEL